jgi:hypothetical protein
MVMLAAFILAKRCACPLLGHEKSKLPESDRDGIPLCEGTYAAPLARMGSLRRDLPAIPQHLPNMSVHLLHAE